VRLDAPAVGRVARGEVGGGRGVALEEPEQPVEAGLAELAAVCVVERAAVAHVQAAQPGGRVGGEGVEVALALVRVFG
jgi:hypothetical protein